MKNFNRLSPKAIDTIVQKASKQYGANPEKFKSSLKSGDMNQILQNINKDDAQKIQNLLADKEATNKLVNSKEFQDLMKKFSD